MLRFSVILLGLIASTVYSNSLTASSCQACALQVPYQNTYWCQVNSTYGFCDSDATLSFNNCTNFFTTTAAAAMNWWVIYDTSACVPASANTASDNWIVSGLNGQTKGYTVNANSNKWWYITNMNTYTSYCGTSLSSVGNSIGNLFNQGINYAQQADYVPQGSIRISVNGGVPTSTYLQWYNFPMTSSGLSASVTNFFTSASVEEANNFGWSNYTYSSSYYTYG